MPPSPKSAALIYPSGFRQPQGALILNQKLRPHFLTKPSTANRPEHRIILSSHLCFIASRELFGFFGCKILCG